MAQSKSSSLSSEVKTKSSPTNSTDSNNKKGIFKKILNRRSISEKSNKKARKDNENKDDGSSMNSSLKSGRTQNVKNKISKKHRGTDYVDNEDNVIYNFDEFETNNRDSGSKTLFDDTSSSSSLNPTETNLALPVDNGGIKGSGLTDSNKIPFPSLEQSYASNNSSLNDYSLSKLTHEYFKFPKYLKINKRNKNSPKILKNLFLAQELNYKGGKKESTDVDSSSEDSSNELSTAETNESSNNYEQKGNYTKQNTHNNDHKIFVMQFSKDGRYLATAGADTLIKIWRVISSPLSRLEYKNVDNGNSMKSSSKKDDVFPFAPVFNDEPFKILRGHTDSIISLDWSKNNFLVTGSMDKTAKLWHVDRDDYLASFQHEDFTTSVNFHPTDDRFFLSGCLDNCVRLWSILEENIAYSINLGDDFLITAAAFTPDGNYCLVGGFNGSIVCLETKGLYTVSRYAIKEDSLIHSFHDNQSKKINGIRVFESTSPSTGEVGEFPLEKWNVLITTNDSKIRLVDPHSKSLVTRFKGLSNKSSSITASISDDCKYIISGSEDHWCYLWENNNSIINNKLNIALAEFLEGKYQSIDKIQKHKRLNYLLNHKKFVKNMSIKEFLEKQQNSNYVANENNSYASFHAHHSKVNAAIFAPETTKSLLAASDDIIYDLKKKGLTVRDNSRHDRKNSEKSNDKEGSHYDNIIVTTDNFGLIRVFRQDSAFQSRKKLIENRKSSKHSAIAYTKKSSTDNADNKDNRIDHLPRLKSSSIYNRSLSPSCDASALKNKFQSKFKTSTSANTAPMTKSYSLKMDSSMSRGGSLAGDDIFSNNTSIPGSLRTPANSDSDATKKSHTGIFGLDGAFMDVAKDDFTSPVVENSSYNPLGEGSHSPDYDPLDVSASTSVDLDLNKRTDGTKLEIHGDRSLSPKGTFKSVESLDDELSNFKIRSVLKSGNDKKNKLMFK